MKNLHNAKEPTLGDSEKGKAAHQPVIPIIVSDDRLGSDEPLDEANSQGGEASVTAVGEDEVLSPDHRVSKIEPDDEHNNENLIEQGLQGHMHDSLTKPRKPEPPMNDLISCFECVRFHIQGAITDMKRS